MVECKVELHMYISALQTSCAGVHSLLHHPTLQHLKFLRRTVRLYDRRCKFNTAMGTKGSNIDNMLQKIHIPYYYGIYAADTLSNKLTTLPIICVIINTDVHTMSGTRWLALIKYQNKSNFFDLLQFSYNALEPSMLNRLKQLNAKRI